jgi:hypothetical protein
LSLLQRYITQKRGLLHGEGHSEEPGDQIEPEMTSERFSITTPIYESHS